MNIVIIMIELYSQINLERSETELEDVWTCSPREGLRQHPQKRKDF